MKPFKVSIIVAIVYLFPPFNLVISTKKTKVSLIILSSKELIKFKKKKKEIPATLYNGGTPTYMKPSSNKALYKKEESYNDLIIYLHLWCAQEAACSTFPCSSKRWGHFSILYLISKEKCQKQSPDVGTIYISIS